MANMDLKRPSRGDSEEELECMQEEFLAGRLQPSAKVVSVGEKRKAVEEVKDSASKGLSQNQTEGGSKKIKSKFKVRKNEEKTSSEKNESIILDNHDIGFPSVIEDIVERDVTGNLVTAPGPVNEPFPKVILRDKGLEGKARDVKKSIFALQMERENFHSSAVSRETTFRLPRTSHAEASSSFIVDGSGLDSSCSGGVVQKIHEENLAKLAEMTNEEILAAQKQLLGQLDPSIVRFLKSKRKQDKETCQVDTKNQQEIMTMGDEQRSSQFSANRDHILASEVEETRSSSSTSCIDMKDKSSEKEIVDSSTTGHKDIELNESGLPINPREAQQWLHMDKVEKEKLAWMTLLPKPNLVDSKTEYSARFDFEGNLLRHDIDLPTQLGLHHHGKEPEVAGYTIEELFRMSRSSLQSQRVIGIRTLAQILSKYWQGLLDGCFKEKFLSQLLEAGIVPLMRWAVDDNTETIIAAAVHAIQSLIVAGPDEVCLDQAFSWFRGYETPSIRPSPQLASEKLENDSDMSELTDSQIISMDVIKGFLRIDLLPRLRYILEVCHPAAAVVGHIFDILIRIARHSLESATQVMNCPRLIQTIINEFLPVHWGTMDSVKGKSRDVYGYPLWPGLKLLRVIASNGRHLATRLVKDFHIMELVACYITIDPSDDKLPLQEILKLSLESLRIWRVFLAYGLASEVYLDLFPVMIRHVQFCQTLSLVEEVEKHRFDYQYAACLVQVLEGVVHIAGNHTEIKSSRRNEKLDQPNFPSVNWTHVTGLFPLIETSLCRWLWEFAHRDITHQGLTVLSSCMNFVGSYLWMSSKQLAENAVDNLEIIERLLHNHILPFLHSKNFCEFLQTLCTFSTLLYPGQNGMQRNSETLVSLGSVMWSGDLSPVLKVNSPFPMLMSVSNLLSLLARIHSHPKQEVYEALLCNSSIVQYLQDLLKKPTWTVHWFSKLELNLLYHLVTLAIEQACGDLKLYHKVALVLVTRISQGDEYMVLELLKRVIFHPNVFLENYDLSSGISQIELGERTIVKSAVGDIIQVSDWKLLQETFEQLPSVSGAYVATLANILSIEKSRWQMEQKSHLLDSLTVECSATPVLPVYWAMMPVIHLYKQNKNGAEATSSYPETVGTISRCLQWCHLLELLTSDIMNSMSVTTRFCHIAAVFLAGNDLFLEPNIQLYLHALIKLLLKNNLPCSLEKKSLYWPDITSFDDFYLELLEHFESVSYGDSLFGSFIMVPLQQCYDSTLRKLLFSEHTPALRILGVPFAQLLVPLDNYLFPLEKDVEMIALYQKSLLSGTLTNTGSPVLYLMAIHHVSHFLFDENETLLKVQSKFINQLLKQKEKETVQNILLYKAPSIQKSDLGFEKWNTLPQERQEHLNKVTRR
ncbi:RNA polymerase II-associated protein 1-like isoform X2 [Limulus polyphemus]|uniref:RNA polymerase II-associated protein 1-like isoform X2 n=1 Tax=Limulus polyphemus TaxID=6850 RepID=A0ABM1T445_LIMPO|nr:RNA polymerase II-associated protein 1-like isoform X2 [Limulus polyphemus]